MLFDYHNSRVTSEICAKKAKGTHAKPPRRQGSQRKILAVSLRLCVRSFLVACPQQAGGFVRVEFSKDELWIS
jgi:hypothetical protein